MMSCFPGSYMPAQKVDDAICEAAAGLFLEARRKNSPKGTDGPRVPSKPGALWATIVCMKFGRTDYVLFLDDSLSAYALSGTGFLMPCAWFYGAVLEGEICEQKFNVTDPLALPGFNDNMTLDERFVSIRPGLEQHGLDHAASRMYPPLRIETNYSYAEMDAYQCTNCHSFDLVTTWELGEITCSSCGVIKADNLFDTRPQREPVDGTIYDASSSRSGHRDASKREYAATMATITRAVGADTPVCDSEHGPSPKRPKHAAADSGDTAVTKIIDAFSSKLDLACASVHGGCDFGEMRYRALSVFTWCLAAQDAGTSSSRPITMRSTVPAAAACMFFGMKLRGFARTDTEICGMFSSLGLSPKSFRTMREDLLGLLNGPGIKHPDILKILERPDPTAALPRLLNRICGDDPTAKNAIRKILSSPRYIEAKRAMTNRSVNVALGALVSLAATETGYTIVEADLASLLGHTVQTIFDARKQAYKLTRQ